MGITWLSVVCRYEMFIDDLPIWGFVGEVKRHKDGSETTLIYTHKTLDISYDKDRVSFRDVAASVPCAAMPVKLPSRPVT